MTITDAHVTDVRVPTSDQMLGSDPFHKAPDYSSALLELTTDQGITGVSAVFTLGAGTDWIAYGIRDLCQLVVGSTLETFCDSPFRFYQRLIDHHQLRWLHDGVFRMAVGAVVNAMWDLWAKREQKPIWKLLVDLEPEFIADCVDWRNLQDALTRDEAVELLQDRRGQIESRQRQMLDRGPKAYCTAGWLGLSDAQIAEAVESLRHRGFDAFKIKVGRALEKDLERLQFMRQTIGTECQLMVDANQYWGVPEAKRHLAHYHGFDLTWVEEPIARDDVLGYVELSRTFADAEFGMACGEQAASPVIFKQLIASGAIQYCQIDAVRVAGVNDVIAIILLAAKFGIPVCPHGGGIGLCNMIQHYGMWDQIAVSGHSRNQLVEYIDFLQDATQYPVRIEDGHYVAPTAPGWGIEYRPEFVARHRYDDGPVWQARPADRKGVRFEV